jgi:adenylate cyclase
LPSGTRNRLAVRIGGHFGPVVVSRLGSAHHQHIAATGDTVNVASRLLEVAKQRRCGVVVSEELFIAAGQPASSPDRAAPLSLEAAIRGRAQSLRVQIWR